MSLLQIKNKIIWIFLFSLGIMGTIKSQEPNVGTEVIEVIKPYTPTLNDFNKIIETPLIEDTIAVKKKEVTYAIQSVPVASTFTPAKGNVAQLEKAPPLLLFDNYVTLGFGTYTTVLADVNTSFNLSRTDQATINLKHLSSQGEIEGVRVDNSFFNTQLSGNYTSRQKEQTFGLDAQIKNQLIHWYGLDQNFTQNIDPQQSYTSFKVGGNIAVEESIFSTARASLQYFTDAYASSELNFKATPEFKFPLLDSFLNIATEIDFLFGNFKEVPNQTTGIEYGFLNGGITPSILINQDDFSLSLGASLVLSVNTQLNETSFFIYPQIEASYSLLPEQVVVFGGVKGGLLQNSYFQFVEENPFVAPNLSITPTNNNYNAFLGLKGKLTNQLSYQLGGQFSNENNKALFQKNSATPFINNTQDYQFGNSFRIVYDDIKTLKIFSKFNVEISKDFEMALQGSFYNYSTNQEIEAWNLPTWDANLISQFNITPKWNGNVSLFLMGTRNDLLTGNQIQTLDAFFDANLQVNYQLNNKLTLFAKGNNLLGTNYQRWLQFPVFGTQALLGATYQFNW